jgi:hypothetical protein
MTCDAKEEYNVANQKNVELFKLMDDLHDHTEGLEHYATGRTKSGSRIPNRLKHIEEHASKIEIIAKKIQQHVQSMKRN